MAKNSVSPQVALNVQSKVKSYIQTIDSLLNDLATNVESLNQHGWYGGAAANDWYNKMSQHYMNAVAANKKLDEMNTKLKSQVNRYKQAVDKRG